MASRVGTIIFKAWERAMTDDTFDWETYYQKIQGRAPRQLLLDVLVKYPAGDAALQAVDLGCGDGTETLALLSRGWQVLAVDGEPKGIERLLGKVPSEGRGRLQTLVSRFEEVTLPPADLIHASYSIPFCHPQHFTALWQKIVNALTPGGRFAGQFFGIHDSWAANPAMTFHTEAQVHALLAGFKIEYFHEEDAGGEAASGPKHWHVFTVIARRQGKVSGS
jgi:tellurite methyltransferase